MSIKRLESLHLHPADDRQHNSVVVTTAAARLEAAEQAEEAKGVEEVGRSLTFSNRLARAAGRRSPAGSLGGRRAQAKSPSTNTRAVQPQLFLAGGDLQADEVAAPSRRDRPRETEAAAGTPSRSLFHLLCAHQLSLRPPLESCPQTAQKTTRRPSLNICNGWHATQRPSE